MVLSLLPRPVKVKWGEGGREGQKEGGRDNLGSATGALSRVALTGSSAKVVRLLPLSPVMRAVRPRLSAGLFETLQCTFSLEKHEIGGNTTSATDDSRTKSTDSEADVESHTELIQNKNLQR